MRRVIVLGSAFLVACGALLLVLLSTGRAPLTLPDASAFTAARDDGGRLIVAVTRDARVLHAGNAVTLDELASILESTEYPEVVFRVDAEARWCHVQWTLSAVAEKTREPIRFIVGAGDAERELIAHCDPSDPCVQATRYYDFGARVAVGVDESGIYSVGARTTTSLRQLRMWIRDISQIAPPAVFAIEARLKTPAIDCLRVLNEFHEIDESAVLCAVEAPHPWIREQRRLPEPRRNHRIEQWLITDLSRQDVAPMCLPVAPCGDEDKDDDPDDRLIINLDRHGRILWREEPKSLEDLRQILDERKRIYHVQQRAKGKTGYEGGDGEREYTRLYVLLRADRDAPWLHVKWILSLLEQEGYFKLQFAVMRPADLSYTDSEAKELGVDRRDELPWVGTALDAKLGCTLPTVEPGPNDVFIDLDAGSMDLATARREIERQRRARRGGGRRVWGRISAPDETPHKSVIAFVNALREAGVHRVIFTGIEPAPRSIAGARKLPR